MRQELQLFFKTRPGLVAHHCTHLCEKIPSRLRVVSHPFSAAPPARRRAQPGAAAHRPSERDLSVLCPAAGRPDELRRRQADDQDGRRVSASRHHHHLNGQMNLRASVKVAAAVAGRRHVYPLPPSLVNPCVRPPGSLKNSVHSLNYSHYARRRRSRIVVVGRRVARGVLRGALLHFQHEHPRRLDVGMVVEAPFVTAAGGGRRESGERRRARGRHPSGRAESAAYKRMSLNVG